MEFRFDPWMLDVDVNATQHDYSKNDYSKEKQLNEELKKAMSFQQSRIFEDFCRKDSIRRFTECL